MTDYPKRYTGSNTENYLMEYTVYVINTLLYVYAKE